MTTHIKGTRYEIDKDFVRKEKYEELVQLAAFLLTDGGLSRDKNTYVIYFTNKSKKLHEQFRLIVKEIIPEILFRTSTYEGVQRVYLNSIKLAKLLFEFSNTYRTAPCKSHPMCALLRGKPELRPCMACIKRFDEKNTAYPDASYPIIENRILLREVLRIISDTEGSISFLIRRKPNYILLKRTLSIACNHPILREQIMEMLLDLDIRSRYNSGSITIEGYAIETFNEKVGFSKGVKVNKGNYKGYDKQSVLEVMLITNMMIKKKQIFPGKIKNLENVLERCIKIYDQTYSQKQVIEFLINC